MRDGIIRVTRQSTFLAPPFGFRNSSSGAVHDKLSSRSRDKMGETTWDGPDPPCLIAPSCRGQVGHKMNSETIPHRAGNDHRRKRYRQGAIVSRNAPALLMRGAALWA